MGKGGIFVRNPAAVFLCCVLWFCVFTTTNFLLPVSAAEEVETVIIDANAPAKPFPHFWENMFGSGRSILSLQENYRKDLRKVKSIADVKYVRFHDIFHDQVGVYDEDKNGKPIYNFTYVDQIYDGLLDNGVRPFVELGFMPNKLAASPPVIHSFWYHPNVTPPKNWDRWAELINKFTTHLIERYGIEEVSKWYFEVWNEPDLEFWGGEPRQPTYYHLYDVTAREIKRVDPHLRVGGPATATKDWITAFIDYCAHNKTPIDFVSTHTYANEWDEEAKKSPMARSATVAGNMAAVKQMVHASPLPNLPIIWTEYNASYNNEVNVTDSEFMGPWIANNIRLCDGLAEGMSFWTFSDVFDEDGVASKPFYGGFGLIAVGGIPKASFNAFKLLHMLGETRFNIDSPSALATRNKDGNVVLAVWNYVSAELDGKPKTVKIILKNTGATKKHARVHLLDKEHGCALTTWLKMGSPAFPTRQQQTALRAAAELPAPQHYFLNSTPGQNQKELTLQLQPKALAVVELID